jgi:hypothetical protein
VKPEVDPRDLGGDPACWSHLFDDPDADLPERGDDEANEPPVPVKPVVKPSAKTG